MSQSSLIKGAQIGIHLKWNKPAFTPEPQNVTSLRLALISRSTEGTRLSRPGWLCEILRWFIAQRRSPIPRRWGIKLATIESQVRRPHQSHYCTRTL